MGMYASDGTLIEKPGGHLLNGSECTLIQTTANGDAFSGATIWGGGATLAQDLTGVDTDGLTLIDDLDTVNPEPAIRDSNGLSFPASPGAGVHFNSAGGFTASPHIKFLGTIDEYDSGTQWLARRNNSWHEFQLVSHQVHDRMDWVVYSGGSSSTNKSSLEFPAFRTTWNGKVVEIECWYSPATGEQVSRIREFGTTPWTTYTASGVTTTIAELAVPDTQMLCLGGINENVTTAPFIYKGVMGYLELRDFDADTLLHRWVPSVVSNTLYDTSGNGGHLTLSGGTKETCFATQDFYAHNHSKGFGRTEGVGSFTLAVVPDMQESSDGRLALWDDVSDWLDTNSDEYQAILCTGDLVNHGNNQTQFDAVTPWITTIDALGKPFLLCAGNHDYSSQGNPTDHTATMFDVAWGQGRLTGKSWWDGGFEGSNARNYYSKHTLNGFKVMVVVLDWVPLKTSVAWAKGIMSANPDYSVVFLNHACLGPDGYIMSASDDYDAAEYAIYDSATMYTAEETWDQIKTEDNLRVIIAGHIFDAAAVSPSQELVADDGHIVTTHVCNFHDNIGDENEQGYIQLLDFTVDGTVVTVKTVSTVDLDEPSSSQYAYTKTGAAITEVPSGDRIPAQEDELFAADGSAITNPGSKVHNDSESTLQQTSATFNDFGGATVWGDGSTQWDKVTFADMMAHTDGVGGSTFTKVDVGGIEMIERAVQSSGAALWVEVTLADFLAKQSGEDNSWFKFVIDNGYCMLDETWQFPVTQALTDAEHNQNVADQGDSGCGVPATLR
jgi:hypothetical protein